MSKRVFMVFMSMLALFLMSPMLASSNPETPVSSDGSIGFAPVVTVESDAIVLPYAGTGKTENAYKDSLAEYEVLKALLPVSAEIGQELILGFDSRIRVYTTTNRAGRATALVTFTGGRCTGFMIGKDTVATAGHCVHSGGVTGSWKENVVVYPGKNQTVNPYGSCTATRLFSVTGWVNDKDEEYDYGAIKLNCDVGNNTGWFGLLAPTNVNATPTIISGYPGDKTNLDQWWSFDIVRSSSATQIFYKNDTYGGMSGSPVWLDVPPGILSVNGPFVIGIHAYGLHGSPPHSDHNHGTRMTPTRINTYKNWISAPKN